MDGGILVQSAMGPQAIIVGGIRAKDPAQMSLSEHDQVVDTFPSDRADQSLCVPVLPWRPWRDRLVPNTHGAYPADDRLVGLSGEINRLRKRDSSVTIAPDG